MDTDDEPYVSWLHENSTHPSGVSWWGRRPDWLRHLVYWVPAMLLLLAAYADSEASPRPDRQTGGVVMVLWIAGVMLALGTFAIVKEAVHIGFLRGASRVLVALAMLIGVLVLALQGLRVTASTCPVGTDERCDLVSEPAQAAPREILETLLRNSADIVPVLDVPQSTGWWRPSTSLDPSFATGIMMVRLYVLVVLLGWVADFWRRISKDSPRITRDSLRRAEETPRPVSG